MKKKTEKRKRTKNSKLHLKTKAPLGVFVFDLPSKEIF